MKKHFLGMALAASAFLAGSISQVPATQQNKSAAKAEESANTQQKQTHEPAKPIMQSVTQRVVTMRPQAMGYDYAPVFRDISQRRRVKYGKHRWIMLG